MASAASSDSVDNQESSLESLNICSYNLHGFTQALPFLQFLCNRHKPPQVIMIQESWLTPSNLYKINNFSPNYTSFGISAMESAVSKGILRGRPFGGCHMLVQSSLCKFVSHIVCKQRFVVLVYKNLVLLNVYLPTVVDDEDECRLVDLLTAIQKRH